MTKGSAKGVRKSWRTQAPADEGRRLADIVTVWPEGATGADGSPETGFLPPAHKKPAVFRLEAQNTCGLGLRREWWIPLLQPLFSPRPNLGI